MTRRLIVMRHAKSSWKSEASSDHARPLARAHCEVLGRALQREPKQSRTQFSIAASQASSIADLVVALELLREFPRSG